MAFDDGIPSAVERREQAKTLLREKQPAEAAALLQERVDREGGDLEDHLLLGIALGQAGQGLQAINVLEGAAAIAPDDPVVQYNLGLIYRHAGRVIDATVAFQRALELRPGYPQAAQALAALNARGATVAAGAEPAAEGPRKCPHCGMETRSTQSCDWCSRPIEPPKPSRAPEPGMAEVAAVKMANSPDAELEAGPLGVRVLRAAWMVISEPTRAVNGGLETFINSPGAALAVLGLYVVTLLPGMLTFSSEEFSRPGTPSPPIPPLLMGLLIPLAGLFISSFVIAIYNSLTGNSETIVGDWGALVLSFAFVTASVTLFCLPVTLTLALTGNVGMLGIGWMVALVVGIWILILEIMVVVSSSDISGFAAFILLGFANGVARFAVGAALSAMTGGQGGP